MGGKFGFVLYGLFTLIALSLSPHQKLHLHFTFTLLQVWKKAIEWKTEEYVFCLRA